MEVALVILLALFGIGFVVGAVLNHSHGRLVRRFHQILVIGWVVWTGVCVVMLYLATVSLCPPGGCIGVALGAVWLGLGLLWLFGGASTTAGIYAARSYLRNH